MKIKIKKIFGISFAWLVFSSIYFIAYAQAEFNQDLSIQSEDLVIDSSVLQGEVTRIYATVKNNSSNDLTGVVKFYDERQKIFIGSDQTISVVAGRTDDVFVDWSSPEKGDHSIAVRIFPWEEAGDNPANNKVTTTIFVDSDFDKDGKGDRQDPDDDNDGVLDVSDALPFDPTESLDFDKDGIGDNKDDDDDNDGVKDIQDAFPLNANESKDTDLDGVGDNEDAFPLDPAETKDSDEDGLGDNDDPNDENKGPKSVIKVEDRVFKTGEAIAFDASLSSDEDGEVAIYEWDFSDGEKATGVTVNKIYEKPGKYIVTLRVYDNKNEYREQQKQVIVELVLASFSPWVWISLSILILVVIVVIFILFKNSKKSNKS